MQLHGVIGYYLYFHRAMSGYGEDYLRVPHPFAAISCEIARLACLIHAASVHSEPGSNSPKQLGFKSLQIGRVLHDKKMSKIENQVLLVF